MIADELRRDGITIVVVGVGDGVVLTELRHIAGGKQNLFVADSFDELVSDSFVEKVRIPCAAAKTRQEIYRTVVVPGT